VLPLAPALYVPVLGRGLVAERYLYLPSAGAALPWRLGGSGGHAGSIGGPPRAP
jgi:hypothetical protein